MIHRRIFDYFLDNSDPWKVCTYLHQICRNGLLSNGSIVFDARRSRNFLLGESYKQNMGHNIKL